MLYKCLFFCTRSSTPDTPGTSKSVSPEVAARQKYFAGEILNPYTYCLVYKIDIKNSYISVKVVKIILFLRPEIPLS